MAEVYEQDCRTRYPVLLVHGTGFRDLKLPVYWGRLPGVLNKHGAWLFYGRQDSWGSTEENARALLLRVKEILERTGAEKINLIGHSKGGIEIRMLVSSLGLGERAASVTAIASPHRGSKTADRLLRAPDSLFNIAAFAVNNWIRVVGDKKPDFIEVCKGFTTKAMEKFNRENPDVAGVFYQSYGCVMKRPFSDINLSTANFIISLIEGPNDGLVALSSALRGPNSHVIKAPGPRGVSHLDSIDFRRSPLSKAAGDFIPELYLSILRDLKQRGC